MALSKNTFDKGIWLDLINQRPKDNKDIRINSFTLPYIYIYIYIYMCVCVCVCVCVRL